LGKQAEYNSVTANWTYSCTASTWTTTTASGTAPSITLPNDGNTYRIELTATSVSSATSGIIVIGLGTSTTNVYATRAVQGTGTQVFPVHVVAQAVVGSGQTIVLVIKDASTATVTFAAAVVNTGSGSSAPAELAAYRVI
jgi:hypothetical protein